MTPVNFPTHDLQRIASIQAQADGELACIAMSWEDWGASGCPCMVVTDRGQRVPIFPMSDAKHGRIQVIAAKETQA